MALQNAFGDLALDTTLQDTNTAVADVETAVAAVETAVSANTDVVELLVDQAILLRKLLKLMESQATIDNLQRQRITIDAITGGLTLGTVSAVTTVTTVSTVSSITAGTLTNLNQLAGVDLRFQWAENARIAYNTGIRSKLTY